MGKKQIPRRGAKSYDVSQKPSPMPCMSDMHSGPKEQGDYEGKAELGSASSTSSGDARRSRSGSRRKDEKASEIFLSEENREKAEKDLRCAMQGGAQWAPSSHLFSRSLES